MARTCFAAAAVMAVAAILPANAADPTGTWLVQDGTAKVRVFPCEEAFCGNVAWLLQPIDTATGKPLTDKLNVNPQLRNRPMLGVAVLLRMQRSGEENKWRGKTYNPDDGKTYAGSIELVAPTRLKVEGCYMIYCQSEYWTRSK
jgi:uncharacterized protein (DUF2147 family)